MSPHTSPESGEPSDELPQTFERRAFVRYPRRLEMLWQFLGVSVPDLARADVFDLSVTGIGLVIDREFADNAILLLRLPSSTQGWNSHLVRVKHCQRQDDGRFQVGCAFVKPLKADQLRALLS
jgi:hypothetical protein